MLQYSYVHSKCSEISSTILNDVIWLEYKIIDTFKLDMINMIISIMPADGPAPIGAWTSTSTRMKQFGLCAHGWPLHNLTELHTTQQHTTELHRTQRLDGVLARLGAICTQTAMYVGPTLAQPSLLSDWLGCEEGYPYGWRTQLSQHITEPPGCVQLGRVLLGCM